MLNNQNFTGRGLNETAREKLMVMEGGNSLSERIWGDLRSI